MVTQPDTFSTHEGILRARESIVAAERNLRAPANKREFAASGLDTPENARAAAELLRRPYGDPSDRAQAEERVVALHFLSLSQHTRPIAASTCSRSKQGTTPAAKRSVQKAAGLWDVLALAKLCGQSDRERLQEFQDDQAASPVGAQAALALASLDEGGEDVP